MATQSTVVTLLLLTGLCVHGAVSAQTLSSPPGYLSVEGSRRSSSFGTQPAFRAQVADGELFGQVAVLREVGFRQESAPYSSVNTARSWTTVTLDVSECDFNTIGSTFATNATTTPTRVFNGSVSWPGTPTNQTIPQAWEAQLAFPFSTAVISTGNADILYDFTFTGGTLANAQTWGRQPIEYYLDSYPDSDQVPAQINKYRSAAGCVDSGATWTQAGWLTFVGTAYGPNWSTSWRNNLRVSLQSFRTGPNAMVAHALDVVGTPSGVTFPGTTCEKLFLQMTPVARLYFGTASASGLGPSIFPSGTANGLVPYQPFFAGLKFWAQAAWNDTVTGALLLTDASEATLPALPRAARHKTVYSADPSAATGGFPQDGYFYNRIMRTR